MDKGGRMRRYGVLVLTGLVAVATGLAIGFWPGGSSPEALRLRPEQVARLRVRMLFAGPFPDGQFERSFTDASQIEQVLAAIRDARRARPGTCACNLALVFDLHDGRSLEVKVPHGHGGQLQRLLLPGAEYAVDRAPLLAALAPLGVTERMVMDRGLPVASTRPE